MPEHIPQPPETFLLGNMLDLSAGEPVQDMIRLAREYGPIYRMVFRKRVVIIVSGQELVNELSDEKRFDKTIRGALGLVRRFAGDGLFTAKTQEPNWSKAHNILLPNFSHKAMQGYHPMMFDIAEQMVSKWARLNADEEIDVVRDMTSLTVDTIGLCGFGYRFNSFYHDAEHPFVSQMANALSTSMDELRDMPLEKMVQHKRDRQFQTDVQGMNEIVDRIIRERRAGGDDSSDKADLLSYMLSGVDKKTGGQLDDLNIRYQVITFLIAGHETTSGMLSFVIYELLKNPDVLAKAYEEVDRVLGRDYSQKPTYAQVNQLKYIEQILKETLRLFPTAPAFALVPFEDTIVGGKYKIKRHHQINVLLPMLHRDKSVWGENAEEFNPDNFTPEREAALPPNAYKPFGNGQRACIGRQFAMQEATLVIGMILQRFELINHTNYIDLKIKETLTMKPDGLKIKVRHRQSPVISPSSFVLRSLPDEPADKASNGQATEEKQKTKDEGQRTKHGTPLLVLYGSNMGTAEEIARRIAQDAEENGFSVQIAALDDYAGRLPKNGLTFIASSSYNGAPPDNAAQFYDWLKETNESLNGVTFAVFGCGNRDWASTFQAVPRSIDERLAELGAKRLYAHGEGDARDDFEGQFQSWYQPLRQLVGKTLNLQFEVDEGSKQLYKLEIVPGAQMSGFVDSFDAKPLRVLANRELHKKTGEHPSERSTRHIELALPENVSYNVGDHLGVIPQNSQNLIERVAARFGFERETYIRLRKQANRKTFLPVEQTISVYRLLRDYIELQEVATRANIKTLADYTDCPPHKIQLLALTGDDEQTAARYREEILDTRKSVLDLLEEYPACALPFEIYLETLPPLRPRYYSISSSPLENPKVSGITVAVVESPARSGNGIYQGVCTNYLARKTEGSQIYAFVKDTKAMFGLPDDATVPIIMIGPGTGIAPFRGFLQERAQLKKQAKEIGDAILFFGCRNPNQDFIYEDELRQFEQQGIVRLSTSFSRVEGQAKCYVQNEIYTRRDEVWQLLEAGAFIYVCGDASRMAPDVRRTFAAIYMEKTGGNAAEAENWLNDLTTQNRYRLDVWASN